MNPQDPKIALYKKRSFGDKLGATFELVKISRKPMLKYMLYFVLPLCMLESICLMNIMNATAEIGVMEISDSASFLPVFLMRYGGTYGLIALFSILITLFFLSLVYALVKFYSETHEEDANITKIINDLIKNYAKKIVILFLFCVAAGIIVFFIMGILLYISLMTLWGIIPFLFIFSIPLRLFVPIYLFEEIGIWNAFIKSFRIGFPTWGGTFLLALITSIISGLFAFIISLPYFLIYVVRGALSGSMDGE